MRAQEIIARKRDGQELTGGDIEAFVRGYVSGNIADYQASAFLMAVYLRGMTNAETVALTQAMATSGETLSLGDLDCTIDKHSTGGVGDKTTLIVVPLLAAAGASVCKMSGRGLGHTGGTLDKLEAIPGFRVGLSPAEMVAQVTRIGACLAGQTDTLAPADKKLYALRDATATVGSLPLIVSSILSKKLAGGAASFLFDVKVGDGAFLPSTEAAHELARALVDGAAGSGRTAAAVLSDMNAPLGYAVGNALEVREAIAVLKNEPGMNKRLRDLCLTLAGEALALCGIASTADAGRVRASELLVSGAGLAKFAEIVTAQGGDVAVCDDPDAVLPVAPVQLSVRATQTGTVSAIAARRVGEIVVALGGGRSRKEDSVDPSVGVVFAVGVGDAVSSGDLLVTVHAATNDAARAASDELQAAITICCAPISVTPLVLTVLR